MKIYSTLLFVVIILTSCDSYQKIKDDNCRILVDSSLPSIKTLLDKTAIDTSYRLGFSIDYSRKEFYLIDLKNKWELNFSKKYFDIQIQYANNNIAIVYCSESGIMDGLTLFPINHSDLFLIDRSSGKKLLDIQSKNGGITKSVIKDETIYFEYYEPDIIRYKEY